MTITEYFIQHRHAGLRKLADGAGTKYRYMLQLVYKEERTPSARLIKKLIAASEGVLTFEGLSTPIRYERKSPK